MTPPTCPKCGAERTTKNTASNYFVGYACLSAIRSGVFQMSAECRIRELEAENNRLSVRIEMQNEDECDIDTQIRELCRAYMDVDGDKYYVPGVVECVESLIRQLESEVKQLRKALATYSINCSLCYGTGMVIVPTINSRTWQKCMKCSTAREALGGAK